MSKYFNNCTTAEELKAAYRQMVKKLHPDNNPGKDTTALFQAMQDEYRYMWERLKTFHRAESGETYTRDTTETAEDFMKIVEEVLRMHLNAEVCGSWVWITGDTRSHKDDLKALGCRWAPKKEAWSWHHEDGKARHYRGSKSMSDIRYKYGSVAYEAAEA